jgi:hypothetical protein
VFGANTSGGIGVSGDRDNGSSMLATTNISGSRH